MRRNTCKSHDFAFKKEIFMIQGRCMNLNIFQDHKNCKIKKLVTNYKFPLYGTSHNVTTLCAIHCVT